VVQLSTQRILLLLSFVTFIYHPLICDFRDVEKAVRASGTWHLDGRNSVYVFPALTATGTTRLLTPLTWCKAAGASV